MPPEERADPADVEVVRRLLRERDPAPMRSGGPVPDGHGGPYRPTPEELREGARFVSAADTQMLQMRLEVYVRDSDQEETQ